MSGVRVLFLGGLGRSGTTLIERVLGELPGVAAAGEVVHLWRWGILDDERCGCGAAFSGCGFWQAVGREAFGPVGWNAPMARRVLALRARVDRGRHLPTLALPATRHPRRDELADYTAAYRDVYDAIGVVSGADVVIDSSKHASLAYCLRHDADVDVRLVQVVRDSRGVAYSWTKEIARPEASDERTHMSRYTPARSALKWNADNAALAALGRLGTPRMLLRYEDFLTDPRAAVVEVAEFADVHLPPGALDYLHDDHVELGAAHTVAGNPMRFRTGRLDLRRDDAWRERLPAGQRRVISSLTAVQMRRYGYRLRAGTPPAVEARVRAS